MQIVYSMQIVTLHTVGGKNWKEFRSIPIVVERIPITNCCRRSTRMRSTLQIRQITTAYYLPVQMKKSIVRSCGKRLLMTSCGISGRQWVERIGKNSNQFQSWWKEFQSRIAAGGIHG